MPPPFQRLTLGEFEQLLARFRFTRQITSVHMHHTWRPNHSQFRGHDTIASMWRFHTQERGFADIAQHLTIAPDGGLWTGRNWNAAPASASGHNGNAVGGPFMFEIVGDFDRGGDRFDGDQRRATLDVIKLVQRKFGLSPESLLFHNQMSSKTCPGSSVDRAAFIADVAAHTVRPSDGASRDARPGPFPVEALAANSAVARVLDRFAAEPGAPGRVDPPDAELEYGDERYAASRAARGADDTGDELSAEVLDGLRHHVINLRMGRFSSDGSMTTTQEDVDALFSEKLQRWIADHPSSDGPARIVFFAHGGLVAESRGLAIARKHVDWWKRNGVYPIYFVWETGLFETISQLLERTKRESVSAADAQRGIVTDWITDPLIEEAVRALQTPRIWGGMKASARLASAPGGGAAFVAERLQSLLAAHPAGKIELHAVGHSAGAIFHSHFLPVCHEKGNATFKTLQLLAPAVTCEEFTKHVLPLANAASPGVEHVTLFTMRRAFEEDDHCAKIYRKSLLYLVSEACEPEPKTPILGLEVSLRADRELKKFFGLGAERSKRGEVVWSKSAEDDGRSASRSPTHGGFDDDAPTMNSALRRILGKADGESVHPYPADSGSRAVRDWSAEVDWPEALARPARIIVPPAPSTAIVPGRTSTPASTGRRRAVCIGINTYPGQPLSGCVADSNLWAQSLRGFGFETVIVTDAAATRARILDELSRIIRESTAGDTLVFQYAGHGTQVDDLDGDEADGDTPGKDEAICPVDFATGAFVIDDDIAAEVAKIADGVRLTFLLDCCHSGTASRFAMSGAGAGSAPRDARPRYLRVTADLQIAHRRFRGGGRSSGGQRGFGPRAAAAVAAMREVTFSACQSHEVAWEVEGQGEYTRRAHEVLRAGTAGLTNAGFYEAVLRAFGPNARQRPHLDCDVSLRDSLWIGIGGA